MRTTVTLDAEVEAKLRATARERNVSFKVALNDTLRAGLRDGAPVGRPYRVRTRSLGVRPGIDLDRGLRLVDELEDAEILRKLDLRK